MPALKAWATSLAAAQKAVSAYGTALTEVQKQVAQQQTAQQPTTSTPTPSGTGSSSSTRTANGTSGSTGSSSSTRTANGTSGSTGSSSNRSSTGATGSSGGSSGASSAMSEDAKQAKILTDQADITAAEQDLTAAQTDLAAATLTAPIGGVVGSVGFTAGQSESSSTGITIVGEGAATVTVPVPVAKLPSIKVGQQAAVSPPGLGRLTGSVTQISMLPTASSSGSSSSSSGVTYDVTITLPETPQTLATGTYAIATITTASASDVLTVPVSAVPGVTSGAARVGVLKDGAVNEVPVTVGAIGGGVAEIRTGLTEGEQVVLADVQAALPTNSSQNVRGVTGPGGGTVRFPGAGGGAAVPGGGGAAPVGRG